MILRSATETQQAKPERDCRGSGAELAAEVNQNDAGTPVQARKTP
jgi:hypothetical protein